MSKLKYKITLYQGDVEAVFRLTESEFKGAKWIMDRGNNYNFEWFAWADYELSPSKRGRFNSLFDYHKDRIFCLDWSEIN